MKKILTALLFLWIVGLANAQVCKISGSGDNVEVFGAVIDCDTVRVTVSNDSESIYANITVRVDVTYTGGAEVTSSFTGRGLAKPHQSSIIAIGIPEKIGGKIPTRVKVTGISGTKCI